MLIDFNIMLMVINTVKSSSQEFGTLFIEFIY